MEVEREALEDKWYGLVAIEAQVERPIDVRQLHWLEGKAIFLRVRYHPRKRQMQYVEIDLVLC